MVKVSASVKDEPLDGTDLLLVADDIVQLDLFKKDDSVHIYAEKMQPHRPKRAKKKKTFSPIESGSINGRQRKPPSYLRNYPSVCKSAVH